MKNCVEKARQLQEKAREMLTRLRPDNPRDSCITRCLTPHHNHPYNTATHRNPSLTSTVDDWMPPLAGRLYVTNPDPEPTMVPASAAEPIDVHDLEVDRVPPRPSLFVTNPDPYSSAVSASKTESTDVDDPAVDRVPPRQSLLVTNADAEPPSVPPSETPPVPVSETPVVPAFEAEYIYVDNLEAEEPQTPQITSQFSEKRGRERLRE
ncbi:hypothetical protein CPLU01_00551 [Colletotrichum plurivorum]|uniref:Uncharacterized protein n=1 Tax=Colletotrichum plurivorum TaxID=2175906 RepID=A0A8H6NRU3_9PEZI|nr:hypothetical protein CPLU01_00551 [Colletotrichum plurivorum]